MVVFTYMLPAGSCSMQLQFLYERRRPRSIPTSELTEACPPNVFRTPCHIWAVQTISRAIRLPECCRMLAILVGYDPQRHPAHGNVAEAGKARRTHLLTHDVPQEYRRALGTSSTKSEPANR